MNESKKSFTAFISFPANNYFIEFRTCPQQPVNMSLEKSLQLLLLSGTPVSFVIRFKSHILGRVVNTGQTTARVGTCGKRLVQGSWHALSSKQSTFHQGQSSRRLHQGNVPRKRYDSGIPPWWWEHCGGNGAWHRQTSGRKLPSQRCP
jgi:hypothetical protein